MKELENYILKDKEEQIWFVLVNSQELFMAMERWLLEDLQHNRSEIYSHSSFSTFFKF
jgi:hypothetical protein